MSDWERVEAESLQAKSACDRIGSSLRRLYPIDSTNPFEDLLRAIDVAEGNRDCSACWSDLD